MPLSKVAPCQRTRGRRKVGFASILGSVKLCVADGAGVEEDTKCAVRESLEELLANWRTVSYSEGSLKFCHSGFWVDICQMHLASSFLGSVIKSY